VAPGVQWELDAVLTPAPIIVETTLGIVIVGIAGWFRIRPFGSNQSDKRETAQCARFGGCAVATERRIEAEFSDGYSGAASGAERNF
jgi:hypothetical protein